MSPTRQSSSGRPGWSQKLQHTTAWESLCPTQDVCCTAERRKLDVSLGNLARQLVTEKVLKTEEEAEEAEEAGGS